ncbi:hypothetical protein [Xiashengella succiniciproducens]|uniref:Uncharacterized protein n=1 Tax=Xiashengella succiniciproducens TaxID=2949635 RepID=A0A9J6ZN67_9BACT|nr:hypothetical protein [Alkaliflexus sp. Ai-910]URW79091.1 hypothetical protein M9189_09525 [Alkaliflexus sp. Ai-910]
MNGIKKISNSFGQTLKDSNLQNVSIGIAETLSDSMLEDGLLKDIPVIGTIVGLGKTSIKITDLLFLKKVISFLSELENVSIKDRKKMIDKIDSSEKFRIKVGEKLLYIIDKCDDHENAQYVSKLFAGYLEREIDYPDFLRGAKVIERIYIGDLVDFIKDDRTVLEPNEIGDYEGTGLYETYTEEVSVRDQDDWKASDKYIVEGGETRAYITDIGDKIRKVLKKRL